MISAKEERTALYRFYDVNERLLYVGITDDPWRRWREHVREKSWYPQVKHQAVTWYDDRMAADIAETVAIRRENPLFNIAGAVRSAKPALPPPLPVVRRPVPEPEPEPEPEPVPEPEPEPKPAPEPGPALEPAESLAPNRGARTLFVILICTAWAFLPSMPGMPHSWHSPLGMALFCSTAIPVTAYTLIVAAPSIHRFGRWLDRTFGPSLENTE